MTNAESVIGLRVAPVSASLRWTAKVVTTDPPKYVPHDEWTVEWTLECDGPLIVVPVIDCAGLRTWARGRRSGASSGARVSMSFHPWDWRNSSRVRVFLAAPDTNVSADVVNEEFKRDPRRFVSIAEHENHQLSTGSLIVLARIDAGPGLYARALLVHSADTETRRAGRWRFRPRLGFVGRQRY